MKLIKIGGSCIQGNETLVAERIKAIADDKPLLVVHGFGPKLRELLSQAGVERETFTTASGVTSHYTDETTVALSYASAAIVQRELRQALAAAGASAAGSCAHPPLVYGVRKKIRVLQDDVVRSITNDRSGKATSFELIGIQRLLSAYKVLLVAPILQSSDHVLLSGDSDALAADLAVASAVSELVFYTDVDGFLRGGETVTQIRADELNTYIGAAKGGMRKKLFYARRCVEAGVGKVVIRNLSGPQSANRETVIYAGQDTAHKQPLH